MALAVWVGIIFSFAKNIKYAIWSFVPMQVWQISVLANDVAVVSIEDQDERLV